MTTTGKHITYWKVKSAPDLAAPPEWEQLDRAPAATTGLHGELRVENDDQMMMIFCEDAAAHERVGRAARDAAALAREWEISHRPWNAESG